MYLQCLQVDMDTSHEQQNWAPGTKRPVLTSRPQQTRRETQALVMSGGLSSPQQLHPWTRRQSTECHPARCSPEQTRDRGSWPLSRASGASEAQHFVKVILVMGPPPPLLLAVRVVPAQALAPPNPQPGASVASGGATTVNACSCADGQSWFMRV